MNQGRTLDSSCSVWMLRGQHLHVLSIHVREQILYVWSVYLLKTLLLERFTYNSEDKLLSQQRVNTATAMQ